MREHLRPGQEVVTAKRDPRRHDFKVGDRVVCVHTHMFNGWRGTVTRVRINGLLMVRFPEAPEDASLWHDFLRLLSVVDAIAEIQP